MAIDKGLRAEDIMTADVICLEADTPVLEAAETLVQAGISGAPVVADGGRLVGLVSEEDLMGAFYEGEVEIGRRSLRDCVVLGTSLITRRVVTAHPETPVHEITRAMMIRKIKRVPILDADRRVVGIVSRRDILRAMAGRARAALGDQAVAAGDR